MLTALYIEGLRYLYVLSTAPLDDALAKGVVAALAGAFGLAAWRLRGAVRAARPAAVRRQNA